MARIITGKANPALLLVLSGAIWIEFRRRGFDAVSIDMAFCSHYFRSMEHALYQIAKSVAELTAKVTSALGECIASPHRCIANIWLPLESSFVHVLNLSYQTFTSAIVACTKAKVLGGANLLSTDLIAVRLSSRALLSVWMMSGAERPRISTSCGLAC